ncbi:MAG: hypothetical protein P1U56_17935 [Saprospiraceae bacterium]|nr:hypothetical protein [Saprospiraceae bacterium]
MIIKPIFNFYFILIFSLVGCNYKKTENKCCELANSELEYDIQCRKLNDSCCVQIGKWTRIDAPSTLVISKYKILDAPYPDTSFQTIIEDGIGVVQRDTTIFFTTLKLEGLFSYQPSSLDFSNNLKVLMTKHGIEFRYLGKSKTIGYDTINQSVVDKTMNFIEKTDRGDE